MLLRLFTFAVLCSFVVTPVSASWFDKLTELVGGATEQSDTNQASGSSGSSALSNADLNGAFKQALEVGSQRVFERLGKENGFNSDPNIRIPLPETMQTVKKWLSKVGLGDSLDSLETRLNRAAENAMPKAKTLFINTVKNMSFEDVKAIYSGGDDAATRFFQEKMSPDLAKEMQPAVQQSLSDVGAVQLYDDIMGDYTSIPFVPDVKANLVDHVVDGGLEGIFHYLAKEEAEIRKNPVKRTTELLKRVFGS